MEFCCWVVTQKVGWNLSARLYTRWGSLNIHQQQFSHFCELKNLLEHLFNRQIPGALPLRLIPYVWAWTQVPTSESILHSGFHTLGRDCIWETALRQQLTKFVRNACSQANSRFKESETMGQDLAICFNKPLSDAEGWETPSERFLKSQDQTLE